MTTKAPTASWPAVVSLSLGIFAIVMSEFLPASLLPASPTTWRCRPA
jgi:predicted MFS family arabinose efflux permease